MLIKKSPEYARYKRHRKKNKKIDTYIIKNNIKNDKGYARCEICHLLFQQLSNLINHI